MAPLNSATAFEQVKNTFSATFNGGNPGSGDSLVLTGTYLGTPSLTIATLNSANSWSASAWSDYNTAVTFPAKTTLSGSTEQWVISSAYTTSALTAGGTSYSPSTNYFHQYFDKLSFSVSSGSGYGNPTFTATIFGTSTPQTLTTTATSYWFDAGSGWTISSTLTGALSNFRWATQTTSGTLSTSSALTNVFAYYNQVSNTFSAAFTGGSPGTGDSLILTGTYFGTTGSTVMTLSSSNSWSASAWSDYSTAVTFPAKTTLSTSSIRWSISNAYTTATLTTGGASYSQTYYHQYLMTLSYSVTGGTGYSAPTFTANAFGTSTPQTLTTGASGYWFDAGATWTVSPNPLTGSTGTEKWLTGQAVTGSVSVTTLAFQYYHQYLQTLSYTVINGGAPTAPTVTGTSLGSAYAPSLTNAATGYWFDGSGTLAISTSTGATGEQWAPSPSSISATSSGTQVVSMYHQYQVTVTASPSGAIGGTFAVTYTAYGTTYSNQQHTTTWTQYTDATKTVTVSSPQSPVGTYTFSSYTNNGVTMNSAQTITLTYSSTHVPPTIDVSNTASTGGATSYTVSLTTTSTNDILYVAVSTGSSNTATISGGSLTWAQRASAAISGSRTLQTFWALKTTAGAITITVTLSGSSASSVVAFAISGANTASPFDTTTSSTNTGSSTTASTTITTTNNDLIIGAVGVRTAGVAITKATGFTAIGSVTSVDPEVGAEYTTVTSPQTNFGVSYTLGSSNNWAIIADAIKGA